MNGRVMVFEGHQAGREAVDVGAVMYCSATGWAFGPLFDSADDCREFMAWVDQDKGADVELRQLSTRELYELHSRWLIATRRAT